MRLLRLLDKQGRGVGEIVVGCEGEVLKTLCPGFLRPRGLFLKSKDEEHIFSVAECPCEVLFSVDTSGHIARLPVGE